MKEQTTKLGAALFTLAIALVVILFAFVAAGFLHAADFVALGPWGDFFGGTLNPILGSATVLALLYTIYLQRQANDLQKEELALTREELSRSADALENQIKTLDKQNFEATFFKMLEMQNDLLNNIDVAKRNGTTLHGRDCFRYFFDLLRGEFREDSGFGGGRNVNEFMTSNNGEPPGQHENWIIISGTYVSYWRL